MQAHLRPLLHAVLRPLAGIALLCCACVAHAQYVWIAPNGTRQYSDQPPPPGTPAAKILKSAGRTVTPPAEPADPASAAAAAAAKPKAMTLAEREADYRKRAQERDEAVRKAEMDTQAAAARRDYCDAMRRSKRTFDAGIPIREVGKDGKQQVMTDSDRAQRTAGIDKALADCR